MNDMNDRGSRKREKRRQRNARARQLSTHVVHFKTADGWGKTYYRSAKAAKERAWHLRHDPKFHSVSVKTTSSRAKPRPAKRGSGHGRGERSKVARRAKAKKPKTKSSFIRPQAASAGRGVGRRWLKRFTGQFIREKAAIPIYLWHVKDNCVYGKLADGRFIRTSIIKSRKNGIVRTRSGSVYRLLPGYSARGVHARLVSGFARRARKK